MDIAAEASHAPDWWDAYGTWLTFVGGLILGAILGHWYGVWAKRPKLTLAYNGSGTDATGWRSQVGFTLAPARLGGQVGETVVFGRTIIPAFTWGVVSAREPARECTALVYAADDKRQVMGLRWIDSQGLIIDGAVTIGPGDTQYVALFGGKSPKADAYYILSEWASTDDPTRFRPDVGGVAHTQPRTFQLVVNQAYGPKLKRKIDIYRTLDGTWQMRHR